MNTHVTHLGDNVTLDEALAQFEAQERARLGLTDHVEHWTDAMIDPNFTAKQRAHTTLLVGGLTIAHDFLVEGALQGLGYNCRRLACPDNDSLRFGKEFGNVSQCNPTYFTVGNLVKELCRLRDEEQLSAEYIMEHYVFLTAGACGPCRFGMYVTEYRKALRDAGFDGFRVTLFQQTGGLKQASGEELGLPLAAAGSAADLIHHIGPLVGRSALGRAKVHASRWVARTTAIATHDTPRLLASLGKVAPYLPAVAKWAATEGFSMLPALTEQAEATLRRWLRPSPEQQRELDRAERPDAVARDVVQLRSRGLRGASDSREKTGEVAVSA